MSARPDDVIAYMYRADIYGPECILSQLPTGEGEAFDGWALAPGADPEPVEVSLDVIAQAFGIDRYDETTFDSGDFPKVVFRDQLESYDECGNCGRELTDA